MRECAVPRCRREVRQPLVFCPAHWARLPGRLRLRLMDDYARHGEDSPAYRLTLVRAANLLACGEGMSLRTALRREARVLKENQRVRRGD